MEEPGDAGEEVLDQLPVVVAPVLWIGVADRSTRVDDEHQVDHVASNGSAAGGGGLATACTGNARPNVQIEFSS